MNSKSVLNKILTLLSLADEKMIQGKTDDGTILQSSNFDVNDDVSVVSEDGTTSPAEDGEYTISFTNPEGKEDTQVISVKGGKIEEISTPEDVAADDTEEMSEAGTTDNPTKGDSQTRKDINSVPGSKVADTKLANEFPAAPKGAKKDEAKSLPNTTDEDPRNSVGNDTDDGKDPIISLSYRISEMEKQMKDMMEKFADMNPPAEEGADESVAPSANLPEDGVAMSADEEELPKLDGAPIENTGFKFNSDTIHKTNNSGKVPNSQNSFLSKLYN